MADNPLKLSSFFDPEGGAEPIIEIATALGTLSKNYKQFAKNLDSDGQKVTAALAGISAQTAGLRQQLASTNLMTEQERAGYVALSTQLAAVYQEQLRLKAAEAGIADTRKLTTDATRVLTSELRQQQQALKEAYATGNTEGIRTAAAEILRLKANSEDLNRALRGANSIYTATAGSYRAMENEARLLGAQLKNLEGSMGSNADEVRDLQKRLGDVNAAIIAFGRGVNDGHANVGRYAESIIEAVTSLERQRKALLTGAEALRTQAQATGLSANEQQHLQAELAQTEAELGKVNGELRNYGVHAQHSSSFTSSLSKNAGELATTFLGAYAGIQGVANAMQQVFDNNVKYSDELVDVRKTTGLSADEAERLAENLKKVDTRTTLDGLLKIAEVGGQLGYTGDEVEGFTKALDVANQALGDDFKGGVEEIATELGKLNTVFGKQLGSDISANLLHIGSALNQLGAVGAATAPQLADVALRTGAVAANAGLGLDKVLSYAAVLQEVGFSAETSGTALNKLFSTLSTKTKASFDIAKLGDANLTLKEFKRLVNTDFEGAIQAFLKGLKAGGDTTTRMNALLATLKLQSGEAKSAIVSLAGNLETYADRQSVANGELKTGTSLATEAAIKNDDLAASWEKLKNNISATLTSGKTAAFFKGLIDFAKDGIFYQEKLQESLQQTVDKAVSAGAASRTVAASTEALLATYTSLATKTSRSTAEQQRLTTTVLALKDRLGDSVVTINQQTGAFELNTTAVQKSISANNDLATAQAKTLARQLQSLNEQRKQTQEMEAALSQSTDARSKQIVDIVTPDQLEKIQRYLTLVKEGSYLAKAGLPVQVTKDQVAAVQGLQAETEKLGAAGLKLENIDRDRAILLAGLKKLHLDEAAALALVAQATGENTRKTDDDVLADKKKKQSVADVAKEEYELQKQRLQNRITDLDRQTDNPANDQAVRTRALEKGVAARKDLAELERVELIREAVQTNKDKINGDQATNIARIRLTEAYQAQILKATLDGDAKVVTLRNHLLDQLAELDKIGLETELAAAEKVRDDVNKSYDERQKAARQAAHVQIEQAQLVRDAEIRNALGALDKIAAAQAKYQAARDKAASTVVVYDSKAAIDEQDASYSRLLLATETLHAKQLISDKEYARQVRDLQIQQEKEAIASLEAQYGETAEVNKRKTALLARETKARVDDEQEKAALIKKIISDVIDYSQQLDTAYTNFKTAQLDARITQVQASYDAEIAAAGDNAALKKQIDAKYQKELAKLNYEKAKQERNAALFSIAINTAVAVARALSDYPLPYALIPAAAAVVIGGLQAAAVLAKPLPAYFKGRESGPAEFAQLGERGPELVGKPGTYRLVAQPSVGYLEQGDKVIPAPQTAQILAQNELVDGRLLQRREQADMEQQAISLRLGSRQQRLAQERAMQHSNNQVIAELRHVRKAIQEQEYHRLNEQDDLVRRVHKENGWQDTVNRRYKGWR